MPAVGRRAVKGAGALENPTRCASRMVLLRSSGSAAARSSSALRKTLIIYESTKACVDLHRLPAFPPQESRTVWHGYSVGDGRHSSWVSRTTPRRAEGSPGEDG